MITEGVALTEILPLAEAVRNRIKPGMTVALEGFTHLIPHAAGHEVIRQGIGGLTLIRMTPDIIYDQMIGMGCASKVMFSWGGNPGVGSLHRFREAYEKGVPHRMDFVEHAHAAMANAYAAGASGMPVAIFKGYQGTDYMDVNSNIKFIDCPFTGEKLAAVPPIRPDVTVIHAQRADRRGNVWMRGIVGIQKEAVLAAKQSIVTVEEIVERVDERQGGVVIPRWVVNTICCVPMGAFPSYAEGYYNRSNSFYVHWDSISRDFRKFNDWMEEYVLATSDFAEFMGKMEKDGFFESQVHVQ
jgi:glutaconate CoA-transferase subunit A